MRTETAPTLAPICPCCTHHSAPPTHGITCFHCPQCGHRWRLPQQEIGGHYYESQKARNDLQAPWFQRKTADRIAALAALLTSKVRRILEVGCAEGVLGQAIKNHSPNVVFDGVEISLDKELARGRLDQVFFTPAAQVESLPYDLIVSFHVLEHVARPEAEIRAWRRLLAPGGQLLIEVPHRSGHPLVNDDCNPEHLHQFTPASLSMLLARQGFTCNHLSLGHYGSPVYTDSLRVIAHVQPSPSEQHALLEQRFQRRMGGPFIAYGAGGDFCNYVLPLADVLDIQALTDTSPAKWGQRIGKHTVTAYSPQHHGAYPLLVCSIRFGATIRQHLLGLGISPQRLIGLEDIYECP